VLLMPLPLFHIGALAPVPRERLTPAKLIRRLKSFQPDVIGLSVVSAGVSAALDNISIIRRILPDAVIVAGGPHPTLITKKGTLLILFFAASCW